MEEFKDLKAINDACADAMISEVRYSELLEKFKSEIRADEREKTLDEFRKRIDEYLNENSDFADLIVTDGAIDTVIEQLKEQSNE